MHQPLSSSDAAVPKCQFANFSKPLIFHVSHSGLGTVLAQNHCGGERVVTYASRSLHPSEQNAVNYSSFNLEPLGLKWAIAEKFKNDLMGTKVVVYTDNNPVAHLQSVWLGQPLNMR